MLSVGASWLIPSPPSHSPPSILTPGLVTVLFIPPSVCFLPSITLYCHSNACECLLTITPRAREPQIHASRHKPTQQHCWPATAGCPPIHPLARTLLPFHSLHTHQTAFRFIFQRTIIAEGYRTGAFACCCGSCGGERVWAGEANRPNPTSSTPSVPCRPMRPSLQHPSSIPQLTFLIIALE